MNHDQSRRSSTIPYGAPESIPSAPPLPTPRPLQRARDAANRFFRYQSLPTSPEENAEGEGVLRGRAARYASLSATQNATATHRTGLEINTIAINESGTHALLGGKELFKTIKVEDGTCAEELNLRSAIRSNPLQASGKPRQVYSIDIADVAWAKGDFGHYAAAATSSGKIILYDLGHAGIQAAQLHEHFRQVHKVTFNPHRGSLLLSGSQDGTVRLWDVRDVKQAQALQSKRKYSGQSDGVRDVKWSPTDGVDFAFGTDSGWIQRWDIRNLKTAKVKVPAHSQTCNTIDWHPDGKHIASASSDRTVRIWDFSTNRRQKASWEIKTPYPVLNARWRPPCESSMFHGDGAWQCTQLVTAYDYLHPVLHVWDFRRPALPFRELAPYPAAPTDLLWHSQDLLWTVGKEGVFLQSDLQHAPKVIERRNLQALAISSRGDVNFVTQKRRVPRVPRRRELPSTTSKSSSLSQSPEHSFLSRSWADDSLDHSFLSFVQPKRGGQSKSNTRTQSISTTTSTSHHSREQDQARTVNLDYILFNRSFSRPPQAAVRGSLPGDDDALIFEYLAKNYKIEVDVTSTNGDFLTAFSALIDHNSRTAEAAGLFRLAQTWKIIGIAAINHLKARAEQAKMAPREPRPHAFQADASLSSLARAIMAPQSGAAPSTSSRQNEGNTNPITCSRKDVKVESNTEHASKDSMIRDWQKDVEDQAAEPKPTPKPEVAAVMPADCGVDVEENKPFKLVEMLQELVTYYAGHGDSQTAAVLLLIFEPVLPRRHPLSRVEKEAVANIYNDCFFARGLSESEIQRAFDDHLQHTVDAGLHPLQVEAIMKTYHDRLVSHGLLNEATCIRVLAYPAFPSVYEEAKGDNHAHIRDRQKPTICHFCWQFNDQETIMACLSCGHSFHSMCLSHVIDDGAVGCVLEGCKCVCFWKKTENKLTVE